MDMRGSLRGGVGGIIGHYGMNRTKDGIPKSFQGRAHSETGGIAHDRARISLWMIDPDEPKMVHTGRFNIGEENKEIKLSYVV